MTIKLLQSEGDKVLLRKVTAASSGVYRCEVTTEDSYTPLSGEGVMTVSGKCLACLVEYLVTKLCMTIILEGKFHA